MNKTLFTILIISILLSGILIFTSSSLKLLGVKKSSVMIHLVTNIKKEDGPPCVAFDVALANIKNGNEVELLFDAEAAWNLKKLEDGKNDFDRYQVPPDLKKLANAQFPDNSLMKLNNFGEFLSLLNKMGTKITVNGTWNILTGVEKTLKGKSNLPNFVEPLNLTELSEHINNSDVYYHY